jgi:alanyl-tRNA synthetase
MFESAVEKIAGGVIPGTVAFKLYDTFGLSLDEQEEMARERSLQIDHAGFETEMEQQRARARASWKGGEGATIAPAYQKLREQHPTRFEGYGNTSLDGSKIVGLLVDHQLVEEVPAGAAAELVLDRTPFYAEAGGQVGDQGVLLKGNDVAARVQDVVAPVRGLSVHKIVSEAPLKVGDLVSGRVSGELREATMRNHTATHLMHAALRKVLGTHVKQAGSVVAPDRLRFDITHYTAMDQAEIDEVERLVNEKILDNIPVVTDVMDLNDAVKTGAMALFGEKYGERVRVVQVDDFSKELCGGTHVNRTGDIGVFKITGESSISAGVRRLEAVTGSGAYEQYRDAIGRIQRLSSILRVAEPELIDAVEKLAADRRNLEREIERLKGKLAQSNVGDLSERYRVIKGIKVIAARVDNLDRTQLRAIADTLRNKLQSGVVVLGTAEDGRVSLISAVTKDLAGSRIHAGKLVGAVAEAVGGKGGGRPDLAEAGGKDSNALSGALDSVYELIERMA